MAAYETKNGWKQADKQEIFEFSKGYMKFLSRGKTERQCVKNAVEIAEQFGFVDLNTVENLTPGARVYLTNRGKNFVAAVLGKEDIRKGINFVIAHIDSPRLDLKQNPVYEDGELCLLKTHYYGGIKKYQWTAIPLALHGVMFTKSGQKIELCVGEAEDDPVFTITDLLPHLSDEQYKKKVGEAIAGEALNVLIGGIPAEGEEKEAIKNNILALLEEKYGIEEEDFLSAEIEVVPAGQARDIGFDRSMVGGYGQDDRVCAYTALSALMMTNTPEKTAVCVLTDKEEIGSMGNTGMRSAFFEYAVATLIQKSVGGYDEFMLKAAFHHSQCLSADVSAGIDPTYDSVQEKRNAPYIGHGVVMTKYTGSRGKAGTSDANAEFVYKIRTIFNQSGAAWQTGELGKVDAGGGGTIAQFVANLDMEVLDVGVPLLSMHAPFEVASKADIYAAFRAYLAFLGSKE